MAIVKNNNSSKKDNTNRWNPSHSWEVNLDCGTVDFRPGNKMVDAVVNPDSICNMLSKAHSLEENQAGNYTVLFKYKREKGDQVKITGFLQACEGIGPEEMLEFLHNLNHGDVVEPMSLEEMEGQWA